MQVPYPGYICRRYGCLLIGSHLIHQGQPALNGTHASQFERFSLVRWQQYEMAFVSVWCHPQLCAPELPPVGRVGSALGMQT